MEDHESGANLDRLHRLLAACQAHRLPDEKRGVVVYYNASRWARFEDHKDATAFRQMFSWAGWDVRSATEPDDPLGFGALVIVPLAAGACVIATYCWASRRARRVAA